MKDGKIKTYTMGEAKLLRDKKELKLNKLEAYMVDTGILTGIYLMPTNISKNKPKRISKQDREKMTTAEKQKDRQLRKEYKDYLEKTKGKHYLKISQSWLELCVYMLGTIECNEKEKFVMTLVEYDVQSRDFNITTQLVDRQSDNRRYYRIPKTDYYLDTDLNGVAVVKAIKNMAKILNIDNDKELLFDIQAI